jgi:uncharacterized membrane protein YdjX (TVP38/TMEM64 family)
MVDRTEGSGLISYEAAGWPAGLLNFWQKFGVFLAIFMMLALVGLSFIPANVSSVSNGFAAGQIMDP